MVHQSGDTWNQILEFIEVLKDWSIPQKSAQ